MLRNSENINEKTFVLLICIVIIPSVLAEEFAKADTAELFAAKAESIREDMSGWPIRIYDTTEKAAANQDLETMTGLLKKAGSVSAMSMQDKVALFNTQEHLNGILTHSDSERLVCERSEKIGSHLQLTTCKTYGEIQRLRRDKQNLLIHNTSHDPLENQNCPIVKPGMNMAACSSHGGGGG